MPRFSEDVLAEFPLDPKRELYWCQCPWCAGTILWGYRKDRPESKGIAGTTLVHTNLLAATGEKSKLLLLTAEGGCERYAMIAATNAREFVHLLANAGAKMKKND